MQRGLIIIAVLSLALAGAAPSAAAEPVATAPEGKPLIEIRLDAEGASWENPFVLTGHKPNFILFTYNSNPNRDPNGLLAGQEADETELKFQISLKYCVFCRESVQWYAGYTQQSYWQIMRFSAPFRETNYEPETFVRWRRKSGGSLFGFTMPVLDVGFSHQSNGRSEPDSRSWNRAYADMWIERGNFHLSIKPWYRFVEPAATDDNPDLARYLGYGEVRAMYGYEKNVFTLMARNNLRSENKGAIEAGWSYPILQPKSMRFYVQYFNGFGENLIDYDHRNNRIGFGIMLNDWL